MKNTFTVEEFRGFLDKALKNSAITPDGKDQVSIELDNAYNRGVRTMYNYALVYMYGEQLNGIGGAEK